MKPTADAIANSTSLVKGIMPTFTLTVNRTHRIGAIANIGAMSVFVEMQWITS